MQRSDLGDQACSIARTLDIIGDRWTPLVLRDVALGVSRFEAIQRDLGISRKVLTERLRLLEEHGVVARQAYQEHPPRFDYVLTAKGQDLAMVLGAIQTFGDAWLADEAGPPLVWRHLGCGEQSSLQLSCSHCGEPVKMGDAIPMRGPGYVDGAAPEIEAALARFAELLG